MPNPTVPSSNLSVSNITSNAADISFTPGDGDGRIVTVTKLPNTVSRPVDPIFNQVGNYGYDYIGSTVYGLGYQFGAGTYAVYRGGILSSIPVTNLEANTKYKVEVIEYNGNAPFTNYWMNGGPHILKGNFKTAKTGILSLRTAVTSVYEETESLDVEIYPNPASNQAVISLGAFEGTASIRLYNISGQVVKQIETTEPAAELNVNELASGLYMVEVNANGQKQVLKFSKQ